MLIAEKIINKFNLKVLNKNKPILGREITGTTIQRFGLELSGSFVNTSNIQSIVAWGNKEEKFLESLESPKMIKETIKKALNEKTPIVLISINVNKIILSSIVGVCDEFKIPIIQIKKRMAEINLEINAFIIKEKAEKISKHGSLAVINGVGVMIIGESGIGKSEALLELVQKGNSFVTDDTVILKKEGNRIMGYPTRITKGFLESRGLGIIDIPLIYGLQSIKEFSVVDLVVELIPIERLNSLDRLGNKVLKYNIFNTYIPKMQIPVGHGRTLSTLIEAATNVFVVKNKGHNSLQKIEKRRKNGLK